MNGKQTKGLNETFSLLGHTGTFQVLGNRREPLTFVLDSSGREHSTGRRLVLHGTDPVYTCFGQGAD